MNHSTLKTMVLAAFALVGAASISAAGLFGSGTTTEDRRVQRFDSIAFGIAGTLKVHRGAQRVVVSGDSDTVADIVTEVASGQLAIHYRTPFDGLGASKVTVDVSLPELRGITVSGSGDGYVDAFKGSEFSGTVSGSGGLKADLDYDRVSLAVSGSGGFDASLQSASLELRCSGSGAAYLRGAARQAEITVSGSGEVGARDLATTESSVTISGSGSVELRAASSLSAMISGSGSIKYWGSPSLSQRSSGSGRVSKAGN